MAKFSSAFIDSLTNPGMLTDARKLGAAIARVPQQYAESQKKNAFMKLMEQGQLAISKQNAPALMNISQQLTKMGYITEGQQLAQTAKEIKAKQERVSLLQSADPRTVAGQEEIGAYFAKEGDIQNTLAARQKAAEIQQENKNQDKFVRRKVSLANSAQKLGLPDLAERIVNMTDPKEVAEASKEIRTSLLGQVPTQNENIRRTLAKQAGIPDEEFDRLELGKASDQVFNKYLDGQAGELKFFLNEGTQKVVPVRVNKNTGQTFDENSGTWVNPETLGIVPAPPQVQRIENIVNSMAQKLGDLGAQSFVETYNGAQKASAALKSINESLPLLDEMFTGAAAELKLNVFRFGKALGIPNMPSSTIANTEVFLSQSGIRVADYITNLGAGTGLSDRDLKFTQQVVGGEITVDKEALKRILKLAKEATQKKIESYKKIRTEVKKELGPDNQAALAFFPDDFSASPSVVPDRPPGVDSYFPNPS